MWEKIKKAIQSAVERWASSTKAGPKDNSFGVEVEGYAVIDRDIKKLQIQRVISPKYHLTTG